MSRPYEFILALSCKDTKGIVLSVAFHHLPLAASASREARRAQEDKIEGSIEAHRIDLVVLARYMQILSDEFCAVVRGRANVMPQLKPDPRCLLGYAGPLRPPCPFGAMESLR